MNKKNLYVAIFMLVAALSCTAISFRNGFSQFERGTLIAAFMFLCFAVMFFRHRNDD
ncbi:hypothetical protein [Sinanaerobacter sp. ZZT-01]|uniref:hypothetical protein n=1 Tax=Sinanaerobacter sp. ZZT-01 TaxID=3111540 RepID=UPI002D791FF3|nr:hypothetical protein [Sinanaerobacter sp. ZZT-01]WRR92333.1 hypothetical protein U5921_09675 [Sinanaerobacter sp. ZZT-01]